MVINCKFWLKFTTLAENFDRLPRNIFSILKERFKALLKIFLIDFDSLTLQRRPQKVIFEHIFLKIRFYIVGFSKLTIGRHIDM